MFYILMRVFFFSSRRRHTRSLCDWSSDVCSSDLSGTNGKTTTSRMLSDIARATGWAPIHNRSGSNLDRGVAAALLADATWSRSEEHTSELQSHSDLVCRLLLEKKKKDIEDLHKKQ